MNGHLSLEDLKDREGEIFGASDEKIGKSKFSIRVKPHKLLSSKDKLPIHPVTTPRKKSFEISILEYLAYGTQEYMLPNKKFSVIISLPDELEKEVINVLRILSTFGGLGSRSRNGFGSFRIRAMNDEDDDFYFNLKKSHYSSELPKYSAFSQKMRLWRTQKCSKWDDALAELGIVYRGARGRIENKHHYEKRQYIGAPIIVNKQQMSKLDRHAKPYFMSVHHEGGNYVGYILYLPSKYGYGKEGLNDSEETKLFEDACSSLNQHLSYKLEEVTL